MTDRPAPALTIIALAWNETDHLRACFASIKPLAKLTGAETLVLFDSAGDPATLEVAHEVADRVVVAPFSNFASQRNKGLDLARSRWVFFIDADERCTPALAREIARAIDTDVCAAYRVPRRNFFFGREVRHAGWSPDYQLRLLRRDLCRYDEARLVHELPTIEGEIGTLRARLIHYNYDSWRQFVEKQRAYSDLEAQALHASGRIARPRSIMGQPLREFKRRFIEYRGYKDGLLGLALSIAMSLYVARTYIKLWHSQMQ